MVLAEKRRLARCAAAAAPVVSGPPQGADSERATRPKVTTSAARLARVAGPTDRLRSIVELGHEPPIQIGEPRIDGRERRRISLRWLAGVALSGLSGLALIGAALYLDLDRQSNFAEAPELANLVRHDEAEGVNPSKGDRLVRPIDVVAAKQTYKAPTTIKIGDKEVVRMRPFTILSTALTLTANSFADAVPPFDPLMVTSGAAEKADAPPDPGPAQDDAEVAFSERDLTADEAVAATGELTLAEAQAQVAELLKAAGSGDDAPALPSQLLLKRTSQAGIDPLGALSYAAAGSVNANAPFASIEVKMVPENVTDVAMTPAPADSRERLAQLRRGEAFEDLLRANGASKDAADAILAAFGVKRGESPVAEGQKIILQYDDVEPGKPATIARVSVYADEQLKSTIAINDEGAYVPVTLPRAAAQHNDADADNGGVSLYESFYETTLKQGLPKPIISEMVRAFANDVDFQRSTQAGDSVTAFVAEPDEIDPHPQLLYASMTVRDQVFKYYRFQTPDDGLVDFYDENGRSVRKFLLRKPIVAGEVTSPFGMRYHPILHYTRMHTGVDWGGVPIGTPILAAGNGVVIKAEYDSTSGYGRRVEIQHANGYVTTYNHMSGFARGIVAGVRVTQGQVIGYLGQSGLATGPHLHYEVIINGNFVDPMAIKLARTREFDGKMLATFKHERDRIEQLMAAAPSAASASAASTAPGGAPQPSASVADKVN
jgi:murein DD-endopeptidase MepM/ murein hydrolase activator NlpD